MGSPRGRERDSDGYGGQGPPPNPLPHSSEVAKAPTVGRSPPAEGRELRAGGSTLL